MRVAISQMDTTMGDFSKIVGRMVAQSKIAAEKDVDILVFPASVLTGYDPAGLLVSEEYLSDFTASLDTLAAELACPCLVPLMLDFGEGEAYECALIEEGVVTPLHLAAYLDRLSTRGDEEVPVDLDSPVTFSLGGTEVGLAFDPDDLEDFATGYAEADVIFFIPFSGYDADEDASALAASISQGCYLADASDANSWLVAVNGVGGYDDTVFTGGSFVLAPWGQLACSLPAFEEAFQTCEIDVVSEGPLVSPKPLPTYDRMEYLWESLVLATRDFVTKRGSHDVCLLLDGGMTSSALATLASDAMGPTHVRVLLSPTLDPDEEACVRELASNLRLDIDQECEGGVDAAACALGVRPDDITEDVRRDLAQVALTELAQRTGSLVLSALDKTELAVGSLPSSLPGDYAPFADVYRSDVAGLVRRRNTVSPVIPASLASNLCVPTNLELETSSDTDEARLSELDAILLLHVEKGMGLTAIAAKHTNESCVDAVLAQVQHNELARRKTPLFPVVSARTFDERAWPATLAWHDHHRDASESLDEDELRARMEELFGKLAPSSEEGDLSQSDAASALGFLSDLAQGGGMRTDGDDLWGTGLFSKN